MVVGLSRTVLEQYRYVSRFDSPYDAHRSGVAIDLYPNGQEAPSPVAGVVRSTARVTARSRPYAIDTDVVTVIETDKHLARILHVDPEVEPGETVGVGDRLGRLLRSGYFGPWVEDHIHLEFRSRDADVRRARGSLPIDIELPVEPVTWDGSGRVIELAPSYAVLDRPGGQRVDDTFYGLATDCGAAVDGGIAHYTGGGLHDLTGGPVSVLGERVGTASPDPGRGSLSRIWWNAVTITANGAPIRGLGCRLWRGGHGGVTLVQPEADFSLGEHVQVAVTPAGRERS